MIQVHVHRSPVTQIDTVTSTALPTPKETGTTTPLTTTTNTQTPPQITRDGTTPTCSKTSTPSFNPEGVEIYRYLQTLNPTVTQAETPTGTATETDQEYGQPKLPKTNRRKKQWYSKRKHNK